MPTACWNRERYALSLLLLSSAACESRRVPEMSGVCSLVLSIETSNNAVQQSVQQSTKGSRKGRDAGTKIAAKSSDNWPPVLQAVTHYREPRQWQRNYSTGML